MRRRGYEGRRAPARVAAWLVLATALALVCRPSIALADEPCRAGNLVRTATEAGTTLGPGRFTLLTDGALAPEGAAWPSSRVVAVVRGRLSFDLGVTVTLRQLFLQSDADQTVHVEVSPDEATWTRLVVPAHDTASGMLSRSLNLPGVPGRYVRVSSPDPAGTVVLGELGLYCQRENARRGLHVVGEWRDEPPGWWSRWKAAHPVSPTADDAVKLSIVAIAGLFIALDQRRRTLSFAAALGVVALFAALAYTNFGDYRYPDFLHEHDVFHYFVGAKYFPELGYDGLYECAAVAESDAGFQQRVELRAQRELRTNRLLGGAEALAHADECRRRFTPGRWQAFSSDVEYFVDSRTVEDWHRILKDHGFNASPTWIAFGRAVAEPLPAAAWSIGRGDSLFAGLIGPLDPLLLLASFAAVTWAFGFRAAALATVVFGCNPLSEYSWVGGGFLRELWLATLLIGLSSLKKRHHVLAGVMLGVSALLQLFPGACLFALALSLAVDATSRRPLDRGVVRVVATALLTIALLVPLSTAVAGRSDAWSAFIANTEKHAATPSGNLVGLPTALSFRMSTRASVLFDETATDPFARVRRARHDNLTPLRPLEFLGVALGLYGLYLRLRARPAAWLTAALGLALVPLFIETSCYYTAWLAPLALVGAGRWRRAIPVLGAVAVSLAILLSVDEVDVSSAFASYALVAMAYAVLFMPAHEPGESPDHA